MQSAFDIKNGEWKISWPGRVAKHDLVYQSPPEDPMQGIALGNGDVGALFWTQGSKLIIALNKCDLWDDLGKNRFHNWAADEEEFSPTLRHACRIIVDFKLPVFDLFYLSDFEGRLSLADATMSIYAAGPFGKINIRAYVDHNSGMLRVDVENKLKEHPATDITLERFGSRTFSHWYSLVNRDATIGLTGTAVSADKTGMYVSHKLTSGTFAVGAKVLADSGAIKYKVEHSFAAATSVLADKFSLVAVVTSPMSGNAISAVKKSMPVDAKDKNISAHKKAWKKFWVRSYMEFGDDYLDNLWHLTMYYANASQRGRYPGRFINGLWTWNRDVQNWNFYFHWNQQEIYWPLNAAGHHDLIESYLDYRFNSLPQAKADAEEILGVDGAIVSDVCDRLGRNSSCEFHNHTPVAQIAMDFWRQYLYTGDADFLAQKVLPYIIEAAKFFESRFEKCGDGKYHTKEATGYEGWILLNDCVTELACARVLFAVAIEAIRLAGVCEPRAEKWCDILHNLADLPQIDIPADMTTECENDKRYAVGSFVGESIIADKILSAGFGVKERRMLCSWIRRKPDAFKMDNLNVMFRKLEAGITPTVPVDCDLENYAGIFPWCELSAVYPSGLVGLSNADSEIFKTLVTTAKLYSNNSMGWDATPIVMARLGLGRELAGLLAKMPDRWQFFCNGWGHYGPEMDMKSESAMRFARRNVRDASDVAKESAEPSQYPAPLWPYRHMGMEAMSVLATAMNEALLQSYDGVIRVAPAITAKQNARFTLHATGGFVVSAEIENGKILWLHVQNKFGGTLKLANPWKRIYCYIGKSNATESTDNLLVLPMQPGQKALFTPDKIGPSDWKLQLLKLLSNKAYKTNETGLSSLGLPRMF